MISPGFQSCEHTLNTLRYANRVKELGTDNMDMKMTDEEDDIEEVNGDDDVMMRKGNVCFVRSISLLLISCIFFLIHFLIEIVVQRRSLPRFSSAFSRS